MTLATKKVIAYIDQNIISNMVKAKEGRIDRPDLVELFEILNQGMRTEKLACPRSWFHREEGSLTSLDPDIQRYLRYIGQVDFLTPFEVEERQFFNAARVFLGEEPYYSGWRECLEDDPDHRLTRFHIDANMPMAIFNFRERRQRHAEALDRARSIVRGRTFAEQLTLERSEVARYLYDSFPFAVQHLFAERPSGLEGLAKFLQTDLATAVVSMDLFTQLCASVLVHHNHRPIQTGDVTDLCAVTAAEILRLVSAETCRPRVRSPILARWSAASFLPRIPLFAISGFSAVHCFNAWAPISASSGWRAWERLPPTLPTWLFKHLRQTPNLVNQGGPDSSQGRIGRSGSFPHSRHSVFVLALPMFRAWPSEQSVPSKFVPAVMGRLLRCLAGW